MNRIDSVPLPPVPLEIIPTDYMVVRGGRDWRPKRFQKIGRTARPHSFQGLPTAREIACEVLKNHGV
jgi:hypothetical protein